MQIGKNSDYLERVPERLVVEGYRRWSTGYRTGSIVSWEMAREHYCDVLGTHNAGMALNSLSQYVRTLKRCAKCPLRSYPHNSMHLCVEECLTLGLISGLQHNDETAKICLQHISCSQLCDEVELAAVDFAHTLKALGYILLPVPLIAINDILHRSTDNSFH